MDIKILDSWLREYLDTKATPQEIAKYVSLSGPTFDRTDAVKVNGKKDWVYEIEVTSNRIDSASVYGIAREVAAILPQFGIKAKLKPLAPKIPKTPKKSLPFDIKEQSKLVNRSLAVVLTGVSGNSPDWMKARLKAAGMRPLNLVVDITNYVMLEVGHPSHAFDYDKIKNKKFIIRESKKGETITSFDGKTYKLPGGDIVFDDGEGKIIDLPGIIGTKNSVVDSKTKRVLFFTDNNDPTRIRKTSMTLAIRTVAASFNEKRVDPELGRVALFRGIELFEKLGGAKIESKVYDFYSNKPTKRSVATTHSFIVRRLGVKVSKSQISSILKALEFTPHWVGDRLRVEVPSFRSHDVTIPEDIVEEVARIYGYHKLPNTLMSGPIPVTNYESSFDFEDEVKEYLSASGANEVYTYSLVTKDWVNSKALRVKNPLGVDTEYLRTSLQPSLLEAAKTNSGEREPFHLFEMANVYLPSKKGLPQEEIIIAGIFSGFEYRRAKGVVEGLLARLNINYSTQLEEAPSFAPGSRLVIKADKAHLGEFGILEDKTYFYYQFRVRSLKSVSLQTSTFKPLIKYPAQIEDITFTLPPKTLVGEVVKLMASLKNISQVELVDIHSNKFTFRTWYQDKTKTLTNKEVEKMRLGLIEKISKKFGGTVKN